MNWARGIDTALAFIPCPACKVQNPVRPNGQGEVDDSCWKCGHALKVLLDGWDGKPKLKPLPVLSQSGGRKFDPYALGGPGDTRGT